MAALPVRSRLNISLGQRWQRRVAGPGLTHTAAATTAATTAASAGPRIQPQSMTAPLQMLTHSCRRSGPNGIPPPPPPPPPPLRSIPCTPWQVDAALDATWQTTVAHRQGSAQDPKMIPGSARALRSTRTHKQRPISRRSLIQSTHTWHRVRCAHLCAAQHISQSSAAPAPGAAAKNRAHTAIVQMAAASPASPCRASAQAHANTAPACSTSSGASGALVVDRGGCIGGGGGRHQVAHRCQTESCEPFWCISCPQLRVWVMLGGAALAFSRGYD